MATHDLVGQSDLLEGHSVDSSRRTSGGRCYKKSRLHFGVSE